MTQAKDAFPTTLPKVVFLAGHGEPPERLRAQNELCRRYWVPLHVYARRRGHSPDAASDLIQGFLARLLEKNDFARVDLGRKSFRRWLRCSFENYASNARDHERTLKRGGRVRHVPCDSAEAERCEAMVTRAAPPDIAFEQARALLVLDRAFEALRAEWARKGRKRWFDAVQGFVTYEDERAYSTIAAELGASTDLVRTEVHRLRRRHRELLCREVAKDVHRPDDLAKELRALLLVLVPEPPPAPIRFPPLPPRQEPAPRAEWSRIVATTGEAP